MLADDFRYATGDRVRYPLAHSAWAPDRLGRADRRADGIRDLLAALLALVSAGSVVANLLSALLHHLADAVGADL